MSGIGHNNGPDMGGGFAFRKLAWGKARAALIPTLPIEILRTRVARAKAIGLPYKTYASVRASTGHDIIGFLFSNNALRVFVNAQQPPAYRMEKLAESVAVKIALAPRHITLGHLDLAAWGTAPTLSATWSDIRTQVQTSVRDANLPRDGVLVIGDHTLERDWSEAARLAGYIPADRFFTP